MRLAPFFGLRVGRSSRGYGFWPVWFELFLFGVLFYSFTERRVSVTRAYRCSSCGAWSGLDWEICPTCEERPIPGYSEAEVAARAAGEPSNYCVGCRETFPGLSFVGLCPDCAMERPFDPDEIPF